MLACVYSVCRAIYSVKKKSIFLLKKKTEIDGKLSTKLKIGADAVKFFFFQMLFAVRNAVGKKEKFDKHL